MSTLSVPLIVPPVEQKDELPSCRLVVVTRPVHLKEGDLELLENILKASVEDPETQALRIQSTDNQPIGFANIQKKVQAECWLVFGLTPRQTGLFLEVQDLQAVPFKDTQLIFAPKLSMLQSNKEQKRQLWSSLKTALETS